MADDPTAGADVERLRAEIQGYVDSLGIPNHAFVNHEARLANLHAGYTYDLLERWAKAERRAERWKEAARFFRSARWKINGGRYRFDACSDIPTACADGAS